MQLLCGISVWYWRLWAPWPAVTPVNSQWRWWWWWWNLLLTVDLLFFVCWCHCWWRVLCVVVVVLMVVTLAWPMCYYCYSIIILFGQWQWWPGSPSGGKVLFYYYSSPLCWLPLLTLVLLPPWPSLCWSPPFPGNPIIVVVPTLVVLLLLFSDGRPRRHCLFFSGDRWKPWHCPFVDSGGVMTSGEWPQALRPPLYSTFPQFPIVVIPHPQWQLYMWKTLLLLLVLFVGRHCDDVVDICVVVLLWRR